MISLFYEKYIAIISIFEKKSLNICYYTPVQNKLYSCGTGRRFNVIHGSVLKINNHKPDYNNIMLDIQLSVIHYGWVQILSNSFYDLSEGGYRNKVIFHYILMVLMYDRIKLRNA